METVLPEGVMTKMCPRGARETDLPETVVVMKVEVSPMAEVVVMAAAVEAFAMTGRLARVTRPSLRKHGFLLSWLIVVRVMVDVPPAGAAVTAVGVSVLVEVLPASVVAVTALRATVGVRTRGGGPARRLELYKSQMQQRSQPFATSSPIKFTPKMLWAVSQEGRLRLSKK